MSEQQRHGAGTVRGGQFATGVRRESQVRLTGDEEYNRDGTFEFPPEPRSFDQMAAFWSKVHVSDDVLRKMQRAYVEEQYNRRVEALTEWKRSNPMPNQTRLGRENPAYRDWILRMSDVDEELQATERADIPPTIARHLARAAGMHEQAVTLAADEHGESDAIDRFMSHEMNIGPGKVAMGPLLAMYPVDRLARETWIDRSSEASVMTAEHLAEII